MSLLPYKAPGWDTHREVALREIAEPLFAVGSLAFEITRSYQGPLETYAAAVLDTLDPVFNGVPLSFTGATSGDLLTFAAEHKLRTGDPVILTVTTGLTDLVDATTYYYIRLSATTGQLAATRADAAAGTEVTFSADGTGTLTPPTAYLVEQSPLKDAGAGDVSYQRVFATVPTSWNDHESYPFTYPAYIRSGTFLGGANINAIAFDVGTGNHILTTATAHGLAISDVVYVSVKFVTSGKTVTQTLFATVLSVPTTTTFSIRGIYSNGTYSSVSGGCAKSTSTRLKPDDQIVDSRIAHDYALTAEASLNTALPITQPFRVTTTSGERVDTLEDGYTIPSATVYADYIASGVEIVAEGSQRRRYRGNIWVRETRFVPAA